MKKIFAVAIAFLLCFSLCSCSSEKTVTVNVEIDCSEIIKNYDDLSDELKSEKYVPSNGIILEETSIEVKEGASAVDVLKAISKEYNIPIDVSAGYAKSINHISEKSCGEMSGWVYEINNEMYMDEYKAKDGDLITWKFVCSFDY